MVKADIKLPDGTIVKIIDGTPKDISSVIDEFHRSGHMKKTGIKQSASRGGPQIRIRELIDDGFFNKKRNINDVQKKLEENGHIYKITQLSTPLKRLVTNREIRRFKEDNIWNYVNF